MIKQLLEEFSRCRIIRKVSGSGCVRSQVFKEALEWYDLKMPWLSIEPDLVIVFEDYRRVVDDVMIVAIELKYFEANRRLRDRLRQAFREIGQPLRYLLLGFDSVVLCHIFDENIDETIINPYSELINSIVEELNLPMVYLALRFSDQDFEIYQPLRIEGSLTIDYVASYMRKLCEAKRNPVKDKPVIVKRRSALKVSLRIPS